MKQLTILMQEQFDKMCSTGKLFRSIVTGDTVWEAYIGSFEPKHNPVFRDPASSTHNCNLCNNFIRRYGNIVAIDENYNIMSIWDLPEDKVPAEFKSVVERISKLIRQKSISDVFFESYNVLVKLPYEKVKKTNSHFQLGVPFNMKQYSKEEAEKFGVVKEGEIRRFDHLNLSLPKQFVNFGTVSTEAFIAPYRDAKQVFMRAMDEIPLDTLELVRDLINQGSLLDGQTHLYKVEVMIVLKKVYDTIPPKKKSNWCWTHSYGHSLAKFRNELIGTLCVELAEGKELNEACQNWNKRVDPSNYMRAVAPITKRQIEEAKAFVVDNGYEDSFNRRLARLDDIKASEIKHINTGDGSVKTVSVFDNVKSTSTRHKRSEFDGVEEVGIEKFMTDILPTCSAVEIFMANRLSENMVTLTTSADKNSKPIFKWSNNYSWTFNGNLAGKSMIKEAVKERGGKVDGVLRFSIMWAEGDPSDNSDLDAHAVEPDGTHIYYASAYRKDRGYSSQNRTRSTGQLDVDIMVPRDHDNKNIVENIVWIDQQKMSRGTYSFYVHQFADRGSKGFRAEIEFDGTIYSYEYPRRVSGEVLVGTVTLTKDGFSIKHHLPESGESSKEVYGIETNQFHKVNLICLSPNHWDENDVGNKYYFFMIDRCKCPVAIRGFHNENLRPSLAQHRKVLEVLGNTNMIPPGGEQLSGLGFNATVRDEVIVRLHGSHKRVLKIKF